MPYSPNKHLYISSNDCDNLIAPESLLLTLLVPASAVIKQKTWHIIYASDYNLIIQSVQQTMQLVNSGPIFVVFLHIHLQSHKIWKYLLLHMKQKLFLYSEVSWSRKFGITFSCESKLSFWIVVSSFIWYICISIQNYDIVWCKWPVVISQIVWLLNNQYIICFRIFWSFNIKDRVLKHSEVLNLADMTYSCCQLVHFDSVHLICIFYIVVCHW